VVRPVYHVAFLPKILKVLRCVCFHCSKLLVDPDDPKIVDIIKKTKSQHRRRLAYIVDVCGKQTICKGSSSFQNSVRENFVSLKELMIKAMCQ
jgi:DNA-directed RNA polymerase II subunit RPB1